MKKALRILGTVAKILVVVLIVAYGLAYWYVTSNKDKLVAQFSEFVSDKIDGKVELGEADVSFFSSFPKISVRVKDMMVTDSLYPVHQHAFFSAKELSASVSLFKLIAKKSALTGLKMKDGSIYFYTDTSGYSNSYLIKSKKDSAGGPKKSDAPISIKNIDLQNVRFILNDEKREKLHDILVNSLSVKISDEGSWINLQLKPDFFISGLAFNLPNGTFLKDTELTGKFLLKYEKLSQKLSFDKIDIGLNDQDFVLSGSFDLGEKNPQFQLSVDNDETDYAAVKKLMPVRIAKSLSKADVDKEFISSALLRGPLRGGEPLINVSWQIDDANVKTIFMDFDDVTCAGYYTNEVVKGLPRKDPNSKIVLKKFDGDWHGIPVTAKRIEILDLRSPILTCDLQSTIEVKKLDEMLNSSSVGLQKGTVVANINYSGPVEYNSETFAKLNGSLVFSNGQIIYKPRGVQINNVNGKIAFKNTNVFIQDLVFDVLNNKVVMNAEALGLVTLMNDDPNKVKIDYRVYSPKLNLGEFLFLFKTRETTKQKSSSTGTFNSFAAKLDNVLDKSRIDLQVNADKVLYRKFAATNFTSNISILQDEYSIQNVSMSGLGGSLQLNGAIKAIGNNKHNVTLSSDIKGVQVNQLLYAFDNFGQDGITSTELSGAFSGKVDVGLKMNSDAVIEPSSSNGKVSFSLKNGQLKNFEPLKKIQKFVFKNRDFETIEFAELKDNFIIKNGDITMQRMEIQSSVLTLFVEGIYSKKGGSDISVQIPLNNLKKRDDEYVPENIGVDKTGGRSVFLRGRTDADGSIQFKLDVFKKYFKDAEAESPSVKAQSNVVDTTKVKKDDGLFKKLKKKIRNN